MAFGKKREKNRAGYMIISFFLLIAIVYLGFNIFDGWIKYKESTKRLEASLSSLDDLTQQYKDLEKTKALENSPTGYEMRVRSKFDLAKPDENVVFITAEDEPKVIPKETGIKKVINSFKNFFN